jgi:hypothetical protein
MKRPKQLPAVDRNQSTKSAAAAPGANVSPSGILETLLGGWGSRLVPHERPPVSWLADGPVAM